MRRAFTLIELLVVISIIALLIAILLPALSSARTSARQMQSATQLRGIQQGFFAFGTDNKEFYPGMQSLTLNAAVDFTSGSDIRTINYNSTNAGNDVIARMCIAFENDLFTPEYAISPAETNPIVQEWNPSQTYGNKDNVVTSYAYSKLDAQGSPVAEGRGQEWRTTGNSRAISIGDRATSLGSFGNPETYQSLWSEREPGWQGGGVFNDNSTFFSYENEIENTSYGKHKNTRPDDIFLGDFDKNDNNAAGGDSHNNCDLFVTRNTGGGRNYLPAE